MVRQPKDNKGLIEIYFEDDNSNAKEQPSTAGASIAEMFEAKRKLNR